MDSIGNYLMSALPLVSVMMLVFIMAVLAVRADGRRTPQSNSGRMARLEERVDALEQRPN